MERSRLSKGDEYTICSEMHYWEARCARYQYSLIISSAASCNKTRLFQTAELGYFLVFSLSLFDLIDVNRLNRKPFCQIKRQTTLSYVERLLTFNAGGVKKCNSRVTND